MTSQTATAAAATKTAKDQKSSDYTVPGVASKDAQSVVFALQERLDSLNDLALTLKHAHWNVVGPQFIAVHEMLDPQVDSVRAMVDVVAERIATMGGVPIGTPGALVANRNWADYPVGRAGTQAHLRALDQVYERVIAAHREAIKTAAEVDPVTEDLLIGQTAELELFQWFVRAHLEPTDG